MNYILNSLEEIQKVYTPSIEELQDSFLPCLPEFKLSKKVILESMRFRIKLSDGKEEEGFSSELSLEAILTGIKFNLISKSSVIHNFDYNYLLNNIDFIVFKEELEKSLADLKKRFYNDIEECRKIPNFEISLSEFLNKLYNSKSFLESLDSEDNIIMIITDCYLKSYRNIISELKIKYEELFPKCFPKEKTLIDWNIAPLDGAKIYRDLIHRKYGEIYDPNKVVKPYEINLKTEIPNPFPDIFKSIDTYNYFIEYNDKHIVEPFIDYSYLFQRLLKDSLIHYVKHFEFMDWLLENNFISNKKYNEFKVERNFRTLAKCHSIQRENNFNTIFKL